MMAKQSAEDVVKDIVNEVEKEAEAAKAAQEATEATDEAPQENAEAVDEQQDAEETKADEEASEESKNPFKKKKEKKDKKDEQIEMLTDQVKRQMAEFENFRRRTEKEKTAMFDMGAKCIIEKLLPVIDNFERGLLAAPTDESAKGFADGMQMIYKQLCTNLTEAGVEPIEAVGKEFDPELHNAVMQVESDEYESGIVAQELQKGYKYHDTVVRHSMVSVVQ